MITEAEIRRLYNSANWRTKTQPVVLAHNPICQFIDETGVQCRQPSQAVHHLLDPKDAPELFLAWLNLVAVCFGHHAGGQRGETQGYRYCHTCGPLGAVYKNGVAYPANHKLYAGVDANSGPLVPTGEVGRQYISTSLGEDALDRALAEPL